MPPFVLTLIGWAFKLPGLFTAAGAWIKANPAKATALGLGLALGWQTWRLSAAQAEVLEEEARVEKAVEWAERLDGELDAQNEAVTTWRLQAEAALEEARQLRAKAQAGYQAELARARALLQRPKDPITCPQAWDRLFQALEGTPYAEAP